MAIITPTNMVRDGGIAHVVTGLTTSLANAVAQVRELGESIHASASTGYADGVVNPTPSTLSTCFYDVLIDRDEKVGFIVNWATSSTAVTAAVVAQQGNAGGTWRSSLGRSAVTLSSTVADRVKTFVLGPFESARHAYVSTSGASAIRLYVSASSSGDDCSEVSITSFKMPVVSYDT